MEKSYYSKHADEQGQTLIETMVAAFVLVMGITAAVSLAVFALNSTTNTTDQIIGLGLAREGVEAIKNARDTNWLQQTTISSSCYNFKTDDNTAYCYDGWLDQSSKNGYDLDPRANPKTFFTVSALPSNDNKLWSITNLNVANAPSENRLYWNGDASSAIFAGYYSSAGTVFSRFSRIINIEPQSPDPSFSHADLGPLVKVTARVWWSGKKCPVVNKWDGATEPPPSCRVELITYLTNWKNY